MQDCSQLSSGSSSEACWAAVQDIVTQQQHGQPPFASDCAAAAAVSLLSMARAESSLQLYPATSERQSNAAFEFKVRQ